MKFFASDLSLGNVREGSFPRLELVAWELSLGNFGLGSLLGSFGLASLAWGLWVGILGLGNWAPEAGGTRPGHAQPLVFRTGVKTL